MLLQSKLLLFGVPMILALGTGVGVAYHDGVMADDVRDLDKAKVGDEVAFRGRVIAVDAKCLEGDKKVGRDVACFVARDLEDANRFVLVSTAETPPAVDDTAVVRGTLEFRHKMDGQSGSYTYPGGCAGADGKSCWSGGAASWNWPGLEVAWVDAASVAKPWVFS